MAKRLVYWLAVGLFAVLPLYGASAAPQIMAVLLLAPKVVEAGITYPRGDATADGNYSQKVAQTKPRMEIDEKILFILCMRSPYKSGVALSFTPEIIRWCTEAAELGNPDAQYLLGVLYEIGHGIPRDGAQAAHWYRLAAEQDFAAAQFRLGALYGRGDGLPQNFSLATRWIERAAVQGHSEAQFELGRMHKYGKGVPRNLSTAVKWLRSAAKQGHAVAQIILGLMYQDGEGVPRDYLEAATWFKRAADQNLSMGHMLLAGLYTEGRGVQRDPIEAFKWATLAAAAEPYHAMLRDVAASMLNGDQIVEGWRRIREWRASYSDALEQQIEQKKVESPANWSTTLADFLLSLKQAKKIAAAPGIGSRVDRNALIADQEVTVQQAADIFERGCAGMSEAIGEEVGGSDVKVQEAIRICLLGTAESVERDLKAAQVSAQVRAKHEAVIREIRRRASTR